MAIINNLKKILLTYIEKKDKIEEKIQNFYPLNLKDKQKRLEWCDLLKVYNRILQILSMSNIEQILKSFEIEALNTTHKIYKEELKKIQKTLKSELISKDDEIGFTELSDPSVNLTWIANLRPKANIIISKNIEPIIPKLLDNKDKIILHVTCTGLGGTFWEPNAPNPAMQIKSTEYLIKQGFPKEQIVLRLDPIILYQNIVKAHFLVLQYFSDLRIRRCRYSFLDQYDFVKEKMINVGVAPTKGFTYSRISMDNFKKEMVSKYPNFEYESCSELTMNDNLGCVSKKDLDILGVKDLILFGSKGSRTGCKCPLNKTEIIKAIPGQCPVNCLYCYFSNPKYDNFKNKKK